MNVDFFIKASDEIILPTRVDVSRDVKIKIFTTNDPRITKRDVGIKENAEFTMFANPCPNAMIQFMSRAF